MGKKGKRERGSSGGGIPGALAQPALDGAFEALREAQGSIEALRRAQQQAAEEVRQASAAVQEAQRAEGGSAESYGEEQYWETRYQRDAAAGAGGGALSSAAIYEWYLPYGDLKRLLLPETARFGGSSARVLVPGCGNSSLCEDVARDGEACLHCHMCQMTLLPTVYAS